MEHASVEDDGSDLEGLALRTSLPGGGSGGGGVCSWFQEGSVTTLRPGAVGLWVHVYSEEGTSGQVRRGAGWVLCMFARACTVEGLASILSGSCDNMLHR
jgi:hypothetical protein